MILVNNQISAEAYGPLQHAAWHGWTFTDLVFPFFLWIVGVSMTFSLAKRVSRGDHRALLMMHISRRAALIFLIGLGLNFLSSFDLATIRIPGVLQRIAVCYLIAGAIFLWFDTRGRIVWTIGLCCLYWILMTLAPVPGCPAGSWTVECNFARWVDGLVLSGHMWSQSRVWDPEGIVSTIPAVCNTLLGIFCGQILAGKRSGEAKTAWLFFTGNVLVFTAMILSTWMPVNKQLWTVPYALLSSGTAYAVFAACYWLVDLHGWRRFTAPFVIFGVNALAMFVVSGMLGRLGSRIRIAGQSLTSLAWRNVYQPLGTEAMASLLYGLTHVALCFAVAWVMYRRNWILRV